MISWGLRKGFAGRRGDDVEIYYLKCLFSTSEMRLQHTVLSRLIAGFFP
jgi:hypothetical protein